MDRRHALSGLLLCLALIAGCRTMGEDVRMIGDQSLYERLGGNDAIIAVVDDFVARVVGDARISGFFAHANIPMLKQRLVDQICQASGGPCTYTGRDMKSAHAGMGITSADFEAMLGDLAASLDKFKVGEREKSELLGALAPLKKEIVEK